MRGDVSLPEVGFLGGHAGHGLVVGVQVGVVVNLQAGGRESGGELWGFGVSGHLSLEKRMTTNAHLAADGILERGARGGRHCRERPGGVVETEGVSSQHWSGVLRGVKKKDGDGGRPE